MTDIVTGANGYLGNVLVKKLLKRGHKVRALVRNTSDLQSLKDLNIELYTGDIGEISSLRKAFDGADNVYHLAGKISLMPGDRNLIHKINYLSTKNVIQACFECKVKRLVYTSSIHALEDTPNGVIINEDVPYCSGTNKSSYDSSKSLASKEVLKAAKEGLDAVIVNPTGIVGPYDFPVSAITKTFIDFTKSKLKLAIMGAYDFVDVRDVAEGHILACEKGKKGENYILSGERVKVSEMMNMLESITGIKAPKYYLPVGFGKFIGSLMPIYYRITGVKPYFTRYTVEVLCSNSYISHEKATKQLGYNPRPIKDSIRDSLTWINEMGYI
ncbi:MAG: SDR family oxidoreductase [Candidatus Humimicrobiaceae bacterium]